MGSVAELSPATLTALIALVRKHTGIAMNERKSVLLERRLRPRMAALALPSYQAYMDRVESDRSEVPHFIDLVTTNDTQFFRTPQIWDYVARQFLPHWQRNHPGQCLDIWSAAAASGEELYSAAVLCEEFKLQHGPLSYRIFASDISQQMLDLAAAGRYSGRSVERLRAAHPALYARYFVADGPDARVRDELKRNISFMRHNLLQPLRPARQFDLILLRNVLIYFDAEHQQAVIDCVRPSMKPDASLILGESESIQRLASGFSFEVPMIYTLRGSQP
jgi:chemotaxis protein methyltransferase CheR